VGCSKRVERMDGSGMDKESKVLLGVGDVKTSCAKVRRAMAEGRNIIRTR